MALLRKNKLEKGNILYSPGMKVGSRYQIIELIGSGAVGTVVRASDSELGGEIIALKMLHPHLRHDQTAFSRFQYEVAVSRQLSYPNIVRVYDFDQVENQDLHFITMECVNGPSLQEYLDVHKGRRLAWEDAVRILNHIAQGLLFAQRKQVIHRDIKPTNILLDRGGTAKLSDFGIAQSLQGPEGLTATGESLGTPCYMSPEHFSGEDQDIRSDIYSLGVVAYEMVTGTVPFDDENYVALARNHMSEPFPEEPLLQSGAPAWYRDLVKRCSAKNLSERFSDCRELLNFINDHASDTLQQPQLKLRGHLQGKPLFHTYLSHRPRLWVRCAVLGLIWFIILLTCFDSRAQGRLFDGIMRVEKSLNTELLGLKAFLRLPNYSPLRSTELIRAMHERDDQAFMHLLRLGVGMDYVDPLGNTSLHLVAKDAQYTFLNMIMKFDTGDLNRVNQFGQTPLHLAFNANNTTAVMKLLRRGSNPNISDQEGNTALHLALIRRDAHLVTLIMTNSDSQVHGWRLNKEGDAPLHIAVRNEDLASIWTLLDSGINPNVQDRSGRTPLMIALDSVKHHQHQVIQLLGLYGASCKSRDHRGKGVENYVSTAQARVLFQELCSS